MESSTPIQAHPPLYRLAGMVFTDLWRVLKPLIVFETAFKGLALALGTLGTAWVISPLVESTGHAAVTNTDITSFMLSPAGILTVVLLALAFLLGSVVELVGVITIAAAYHGGRNVTAADTLAALRSVALRVVSFGIAKLGLLAVLGAPFVVLAGLVYLLLLTGHDINYYLANHPPSWYLALALGGLITAALGAALAVLYVGTLFAVPILLLEKRSVRAAIRDSWARTRGARTWIGSVMLGWQIVGMIAGVLVVWGFGRSCALILASAGSRTTVLVAVVGVLLACHAVLLAALSFAIVSIHGLLVFRLYLERGGQPQPFEPAAERGLLTLADARAVRLMWSKAGIAIAVLILIGFMALGFSRRLDEHEQIVVVAHRGASRSAPENSMNAFRNAIEAGADVIELDVQETADGVIVVTHDRDLMRMAGDPRAIAELSFAELRKLDIGRRRGAEFAGERIATLEEVIALARGKAKLQIELKYYGKDQGLAEKVADLIRRESFENECEVSSLSNEGLMKAKKRNPRLSVIALVTYAVGDPGRLDVDGLSVNAALMSDRLIKVARAKRKRLYAWTVDEPRQMVRLIERGVGGIVTNAPEELVRIRRERANLTDFERRLLAARYLLGLDDAN
jgi:glycerophosphoryl diester phosphodiesterase